MYTKFGLNRSIRFRDIEQKLNYYVTLLQISRNSNSFKVSCMSSLPARMKKIQLKMKALECSQDFSHYKSMGIFPDAQWQLTLQSLVRSGQISNSSKTVYLSSLPAMIQNLVSICQFCQSEQKPKSDVNLGPLLFCKFAKNNDLRYQHRSCQ